MDSKAPRFRVTAPEGLNEGARLWVHDDGFAHPHPQHGEPWLGLVGVRNDQDPSGWSVVQTDGAVDAS